MGVHALITGMLFRAPEQRISRAGKPFWSATLRVKDGDATQWWKLLVFSESAGAELMRLGDGDALSAQGVFKAEPYDKDGETRIGFTLFAEHVLALKQPPRERKPKADHPARPDRARDDRPRADADLDDTMPF